MFPGHLTNRPRRRLYDREKLYKHHCATGEGSGGEVDLKLFVDVKKFVIGSESRVNKRLLSKLYGAI